MAGPAGDAAGAQLSARMAGSPEDRREFLVVFAHHNMYFNMRFQELEALADLLGLAVSREGLYVDTPPTALLASPLVHVRLRGGEAAARRLCERAVLVKAVLEIWACGRDYGEAIGCALLEGEAAHAQRRPFLAPPKTFQIRVVAFGRTATLEDKHEVIEQIRPLFDGDEVADLRSPDTTVWALQEHEHHTELKTHLGPRMTQPQRVFVGRQVAGGRSVDKKLADGEKAFFQRYDLSQRAVLGPTTLDNELAFIMANCAQVRSGQVALEPFCGTGGILLALSHFGARAVGGEIDIRVVRGWRIAYTKNRAAALDAVRQRSQAARAASSNAAPAVAPGAAVAAAASRRDAGGLSLEHLMAIGLVPASLIPPAGGAPVGAGPPASVDCSLGDGQRGAGHGVPTASGSLPLQAAGEAALAAEDLTAASAGSAVAGAAVAEGTAEPCRGEGKDIFTNFVQYGLPLPEVVICDNAISPWRDVEDGWCDCIVTDPPYGVRAGAKKQGRTPGHRHVKIVDAATYIPSKVNYEEDELSRDLLTLAADALRDGGRLVLLVPVDLADFIGIDRAASERGGGPRETLHNSAMPKGGRKKDSRLCISETSRDPRLLDEARYRDFIPAHVALELVGASLQILSGGLGRLLVTMRRRPRTPR